MYLIIEKSIYVDLEIASWDKKQDYTIRDVCVQGNGSLIRPAASHITDGVTSATQHEQREVEGLHVLHTLGMT